MLNVQKRNVMNKKNQDRAYFISFCIEQYKNEKGLTGAEAMYQLDKYGVLNYLYNLLISYTPKVNNGCLLI